MDLREPPPAEICGECIASLQGHWLSAIAIYCLHRRAFAVRSASRPSWRLIYGVSPRDAARRLANAGEYIRSQAAKAGVTLAELDHQMQKVYDRAHLSARAFHERYGVAHTKPTSAETN